jgi:hypothetical protein
MIELLFNPITKNRIIAIVAININKAELVNETSIPAISISTNLVIANWCIGSIGLLVLMNGNF